MAHCSARSLADVGIRPFGYITSMVVTITTHEIPDALLNALTEAYQEAVGRHRDVQPS
jgi:hypothetical protein